MFNTTKFSRTILLPVALVGALSGFAAGCGDGGIDQSKLNDAKQKSQEIQVDAKKATADAQQVSADVQSGKISAEEGQKKLEDSTEQIKDKANAISSDAIDAVKDNKYLSDADKKQLEEAQATLNK